MLSTLLSLPKYDTNFYSYLFSCCKTVKECRNKIIHCISYYSLLSGDGLSVADLGLYSAVKQLQLEKELQPELASWFSRTQAQLGGAETGNKKSGKPAQEKGKSPKKEVKKEKSPVKEVKSENKPQKSGKSDSDSVGFDKEKLFHYFEKNSIPFKNVDHPAVFTVEAMLPYMNQLEKLEAARSAYLCLPFLTYPYLSLPFLTFPYLSLHLSLPFLTKPYLSLLSLTKPYLALLSLT